jgi:parvulin-like peptidyl-prolyl isomerase
MKSPFRIIVIILATFPIATAQVASHQPTDVKGMTNAPTRSASAAPAMTSVEVTGKPVARVNGVELTDRDLLREMFQLFPYARVHNGFPKSQEPEIRRGALSMIEFEELVYQEAERRKMVIPAARVNQAVAEYRKRFQSEEDFDQYLKAEMGGSMDRLRKQVRRSLLIDAMLKQEVNNRSGVTLEEARAFYDKNPKLFSHGESFAFQTISIMPAADASSQQKESARKKAEEILKQAKATKSYQEFGLLAEKVSEDDYRVNMGDHKLVARERLPDEVVRRALAMRPGQVSDLIQAGSFYFCFRLNQHVPPGRVRFAEVRPKLMTDLKKLKSEDLRKKLDAKLRVNAKVEEL